jgi:hypothetical protein
MEDSKNPASTNGLLQLTNDIPLAVPIIGLSPPGRVFQSINGIWPNRLPKLMPASTVKTLLRFVCKQKQPTLQIFELSDSHEIKNLI